MSSELNKVELTKIDLSMVVDGKFLLERVKGVFKRCPKDLRIKT